MDFNHFLTSYMPDPAIGSKIHFKNMLDQSVLAEQLGYVAVSIPEHHLVNVLMMPSPLQMAVKISTLTKHIKITTGVAVVFMVTSLTLAYLSSDSAHDSVVRDIQPSATKVPNSNQMLLPEKDKQQVTYASSQINYPVKPGRMIFFPSYMPHQYVVDMGYEPFRFIHWNCQAIPKGVLNVQKK